MEEWYRPGYQEWCAAVDAARKKTAQAAIAVADTMGRYDPMDWDEAANDFCSVDSVQQKFNAWVEAQAEWRAIMENP